MKRKMKNRKKEGETPEKLMEILILCRKDATKLTSEKAVT